MNNNASSHNSKDPLGHIKIAVSNFPKSSEFYGWLFDQLGYEQVSDKEHRAGWVNPGDFGIWITQAEIPEYGYKFTAPGLHHLCLKAESPERVDEIHRGLLEKGVTVTDAPQKYPEYAEKYYAVFFTDPDGIRLEVAYY